MTTVSAPRILAAVCFAQVFAQIGAYTLPALLPTFIREWSLSNTEAGWLIGVFYASYVLAVPVLVSLTDRIDARSVYIFSVTLTIISHLGFAFFADDFTAGMVFRFLAGVGWAGTYMPGLKTLTDHLDGKMQTRAVSFHAAGVGISGSISFVVAATVESFSGWQEAFIAAAGFSATALLIALVFMPRQQKSADAQGHIRGHFLDFRPVIRNRSALAYALNYMVHTWEMSVLRNWVVVLLVYVAAKNGLENPPIPPAYVVTLLGLMGTWASIVGNEAAIRFGRQRWVLMVFAVSMFMAIVVGLSSARLYIVVAVLCMIYGTLSYADSSALTAGASGSAEPGRRGATLAFHSMLGYAGGFIGPVVFGIILDLAGGQSFTGWAIAFAHIAIILMIGPWAIIKFKPKDLPGDKPWR
jgi:MFS family permease